MWRLLEAAAKSASANASEYVVSVSERAQSLVASVQDEAATLLQSLGSARAGPVDEILYEEIDDFKAFSEAFAVDAHTDEIASVLREQDAISELHEELVPVQLSFEEFWRRYFFRKHQGDENKRLEEERREQQRLEAEERAHEQDASDSDLALESHGDRDDDGDDDPERTAGSSLDRAAESDPLALKARDADRRAALAWRQKAAELQQKLGAMAAQLAEAKRAVAEEKDIELQNLCDSYEAKMAEATMQIDDARAVGYDAGIQESEAIIAAMRQAADEEIERLNRQLARRDQSDGAGATERADSGGESVLQLKEALSLRTQTLASVSAEKVAVETLLVAKDEEIAALRAQLEDANRLAAPTAGQESRRSDDSASPVTVTFSDAEEKLEITQQLEAARAQIQSLETQLQAQQSAAAASPEGGQVPEETRKELELWRMRALKMKKMKELVESELQALKASQPAQDGSARIAELEAQRDALIAGKTDLEVAHRAEVEALKQQVAETAATLAAQEEKAFKRGMAEGKAEVEAQIVELEDRADRSYESGFEAATWAAQKEIDLLRTEIALLRAGSPELADSEAEPDVIWSVPVPVLGDEFSDTDAMSHSIDNLSTVFGGDASAGENENGGEAWDASASVSDGASEATRDDWGEW
ncbi:hypothetical protein PybrP1_005786 [[Pythium] brassicae (nom. inval.)]|nr:hypothetical protein PybrP1_005786 [[Pythium] brassicae (nom. inval.)]